MRQGTVGLLVGMLALVGLASMPGRVLAQRYGEPVDHHSMAFNGPQFVVDHWKQDPIFEMGTNPGLGWRVFVPFSDHVLWSLSPNVFWHHISGASVAKTVYIELPISLIIVPGGLSRSWAPYIGGGYTGVRAGGDVGGSSAMIVAGVIQPRRRLAPFFELQWATGGKRVSATAGLLL